jgi:hypothetical protein
MQPQAEATDKAKPTPEPDMNAIIRGRVAENDERRRQHLASHQKEQSNDSNSDESHPD